MAAAEAAAVRVKVRIGDREFTYDAPEGVRVGDRVEVPPFSYLPAGAKPMTGEVTAIGSDYDGEVRPVRVPRLDAPPPLTLDWADISAALMQAGLGEAEAAAVAPDGALVLSFPGVAAALVFAAALAARLTAADLICACCTDNECQCEGTELRSDRWQVRPRTPGLPAARLMALASDHLTPREDDPAVPGLVLTFAGAVITGTTEEDRQICPS